MMMVYSAVNVPYASLLGVISDNPRTRTELSSYRMLFAFGGSLLALLLIEPLVGWFSRGSTPPDGLAGRRRNPGGRRNGLPFSAPTPGRANACVRSARSVRRSATT